MILILNSFVFFCFSSDPPEIMRFLCLCDDDVLHSFFGQEKGHDYDQEKGMGEKTTRKNIIIINFK